MEKAVPIKTDLGVLSGRDSIYLNTLNQDDKNNMLFIGEINATLAPINKNEKEWIAYKLNFKGVIACFSCELDTYENLNNEYQESRSSFDLIEKSNWLQSLPIRKDYGKENYNHYRLSTYDIVYDIIATSYQMEIDI